MSSVYADVIVDITNEKLDRTFQYKVPPELTGEIGPGTAVQIPFGNGNRTITGYVLSVGNEPKYPQDRMKAILAVQKDAATVETKLIALAAWMRHTYGSTMIQALKTVLPVNVKARGKETREIALLADPAECEELLAYAKSIVVFDHHRQTKNVIANATLSYIEPFASSACEMIAEMLQYMDEKIKLRPTEADAMYAGILIDTDNFLSKTGVRTFEAAAFLKRSGADVMRVRKMFRTDIESYRQKAEGVSHAEMVLDAFAISIITPEKGPESPLVLTAKIANEMLNIAGVRASFVIAQVGDDVKISARAIDDVNVQIIMERMGGGGHANIAAAQFENAKAEDIKVKLVDLLNEMYKEGDI